MASRTFLWPSFARFGPTASSAVVIFVILSGPAAATPPCPPFSYSVSYSSPLCNVTFLAHSGPVPLEGIWWANWWNGTPNYTTGAGFERASDHVNRTATSGDRVTVMDRDGDRNLSEGDTLEVWSSGGCGGNLLLILGTNATATSGQTLQLQDGYSTVCGGSPPDLFGPIVIALAVAAAIVLTMAFLLRRRPPRAH